MSENTPDPKPKNNVLAIYGGLLIVYFGVVIFGLYRSLSVGKPVMQAITENAGSLAIFAACLALFAASMLGRKT